MADSSDPINKLKAALEDRYTIERELGEGGMATVYLAEDLRHERRVALKVLKPELVVAYDLNAEGDRLIIARNATGTNAADPERLILVQNFFEELRRVVPEC